MNAETILNFIWRALNTPVAITGMAGVFLWLLNRLYAAKPGWASYEGAILSGIKFAEKEVPDSASRKGLARLDTALKYVLKVYAQTNGKRASAKIAAEIREGIQITDDKLEAVGRLKK